MFALATEFLFTNEIGKEAMMSLSSETLLLKLNKAISQTSASSEGY